MDDAHLPFEMLAYHITYYSKYPDNPFAPPDEDAYPPYAPVAAGETWEEAPDD